MGRSSNFILGYASGFHHLNEIFQLLFRFFRLCSAALGSAIGVIFNRSVGVHLQLLGHLTKVMNVLIVENKKFKIKFSEWQRIRECRNFHPKMMSACSRGKYLPDGTL